MIGPGRARALAELDAGPACPPQLQHVWEWYGRLAMTRSGMGGGIPETEIYAFFVNRHIHPLPEEVEAIAALDALCLEVNEKK